MKLSVIQRSAIGLCFALLLALLVGVWLHHTIQLSMQSEQWLDHTNEVLSTMSNMGRAAERRGDRVARLCRHGVRRRPTSDRAFLQRREGISKATSWVSRGESTSPETACQSRSTRQEVDRRGQFDGARVGAYSAGSLGRHTDSNSRRHSPATARHAQRRANSHARSLGGAKRGHADDHGFCLVGQRSDAFSPQCIGIFDDSRSPRTDQDRANPDGQNATVGGGEQGIGIVQLQRFARLARSAALDERLCQDSRGGFWPAVGEWRSCAISA